MNHLKRNFVLLILILATGFYTAQAQESDDTSYAYYKGETYTYSFKAPENWVLNLEEAYAEGYTAAMYPEGQEYYDSRMIIYVWIFKNTDKSLTQFISADSAHYVKRNGIGFLRTDTLDLEGGDIAIILEVDDPGGASKLAMIGYIDAVTEIVIYELHIA
ncbi:MAG: hypothetical protein JSU69_00230, partial [Candidatus Zixiibacteriota bacterium]